MNNLFEYYEGVKTKRQQLDEQIKNNTQEIIALFEKNLDVMVYDACNKNYVYESIIHKLNQSYKGVYDKKIIRSYLVKHFVFPLIYKRFMWTILTGLFLSGVSYVLYTYADHVIFQLYSTTALASYIVIGTAYLASNDRIFEG